MRICHASLVLLIVLTKWAWGQGLVTEKHLTHNGLQREYIMFVPSGYQNGQKMPLVLNIHGYKSWGAEQMEFSAMNRVAEREGFLVAYPTAYDNDWSDDIPFVVNDSSGDNSLSFFDSLLETIASEYSIDSSRIYSTGFSQGGITSYVLAAARPRTFAAIAPVSGLRYFANRTDELAEALYPLSVPSLPNGPLPILHVHGTADQIVPYAGGPVGLDGPDAGVRDVRFPSVESTVAEWANLNGCDPLPFEHNLDDVYPQDRSTVTVFSYQNCSSYESTSGQLDSAEVTFYRVNNAAHGWPSDPALRATWADESWARANSDFDGSSVIWDFFSRHQLRAVPGGGAGDLDNDGDLDSADIDALASAVRSGLTETKFDLNGDNQVNDADRTTWITTLKKTYFGDSNLDGEFNSSDLIAVFEAGQYADNIAGNSGWATGDWNGDAEFNSSDLVVAFQDGGYEQGPRAAVLAVPEPASAWLLLAGIMLLMRRQ